MDSDEFKPDYTRILKALRFEEPDRLPTMELIVDLPIQGQFLGRPVRSMEDEIDFYVQAGYDYFYQKAGYEFPGIPPVMSFGTQILSDAEAAGANTSFDGRAECPLKDRDGFARYTWPDPDEIDTSKLDIAARKLPDGMGIVAGMGGIFARSWILMGFENFCVALMTDPDYVAQVFDAIGLIQVEMVRRIINKPRVFALWYSDDFAYAQAPMVHPDAIRKYLFPYMRQMVKIAHDAGLPVFYHGCGNLLPVLDGLIDMGIDALHPIEPKAIDIYDLKPKLYGKVALVGNIDVGQVLTMGTPEQIDADVKEHIRRLAPGGGYVISSSNSIAHYIPIENYRAFLSAIRKYGRYPIAC